MGLSYVLLQEPINLGDDEFMCGARVGDASPASAQKESVVAILELASHREGDVHNLLANISETRASIMSLAKEALADGRSQSIALSIDNDGLLQQLLSPRTQIDASFEERLKCLIDLFTSMRREFPEITLGVALCAEELCPGGLDPLMGCNAALAFEAAGADFLIASGGTQDLPALKWRKPTRQKQHNDGESATYLSAEMFLQSGLWLIDKLKIPIWAQGTVSDMNAAKSLAKRLGYRGIVDTQ
jgi:hypothetical protein